MVPEISRVINGKEIIAQDYISLIPFWWTLFCANPLTSLGNS